MPTDIVGPIAEYQDKLHQHKPVLAYQVYRAIQLESTWLGQHIVMHALPGDFVVTTTDSNEQAIFSADQFINIYEPKESDSNE